MIKFRKFLVCFFVFFHISEKIFFCRFFGEKKIVSVEKYDRLSNLTRKIFFSKANEGNSKRIFSRKMENFLKSQETKIQNFRLQFFFS